MQFPVDLHIAGITIKSHFIFEMLAYTVGFQYFLWLRKRSQDSISSLHRAWLLLGVITGGLIGSRLIGVLEDPELLRQHSRDFIWLMNTKTILGGLLGGLAGTEITKKILGIRQSSGDLITYPLILGMMIGRVGCFLAGLEDHTFGSESSLPWAIDLGDGVRRHPLVLYEIAWLAATWVLLALLQRKRALAEGFRFKLFMVSYLIFRLWVEALKPAWRLPIGLSVLQLTAIGGLVYYYKVMLFPKRWFLQ
jgi:prolipoprotein diacylglyceryltransferase